MRVVPDDEVTAGTAEYTSARVARAVSGESLRRRPRVIAVESRELLNELQEKEAGGGGWMTGGRGFGSYEKVIMAWGRVLCASSNSSEGFSFLAVSICKVSDTKDISIISYIRFK